MTKGDLLARLLLAVAVTSCCARSAAVSSPRSPMVLIDVDSFHIAVPAGWSLMISPNVPSDRYVVMTSSSLPHVAVAVRVLPLAAYTSGSIGMAAYLRNNASLVDWPESTQVIRGGRGPNSACLIATSGTFVRAACGYAGDNTVSYIHVAHMPIDSFARFGGLDALRAILYSVRD